MVTSLNFILAGLGAVIVTFLLFRKDGNNESLNLPEPESIITENPQIQILKDAIAGVQNFIKSTFPPIFKPVITHPSQARGPNSIGIFGARGTLTTIDPFTGQRIALAGSSKFQQITGTNFALNQARVTQGVALKLEATNIIQDLQGQLSILETKSV